MARTLWLLTIITACLGFAPRIHARPPAAGAAVRGSLVEDRAARKLLEAGDLRFDSDEFKEAIEVWKSVIERYPRSRVRFDAMMRLGNHYLTNDRAYDQARANFEAVLVEENRDEAQLADATLKVGICFYEARIYGKCFQVMRDVIEKFPVSPQVNEAYHYIGLGHFQLGHYSRAISALEKVGTALETEEGRADKVEAGKRFFIKIDDADLSALEQGASVKVQCKATSGDVEVVECFPVGRNVRVVLGSILTRLGKSHENDGELQLKGDDKVTVTYIDQHTADKQLNRDVLREVTVVGNANVSVMDGAFKETLRGVVLGKPVNVQISDADRDLLDESDKVQVRIEVYRSKTDEEVDAEIAAALVKDKGAADPAAKPASEIELDDEGKPKIDRFKKIDSLELPLVEVAVKRDVTTLAPSTAESEDAAAGDKPAEAAPASEKPAAGEKPADEKPAAKPEKPAAKPAAGDKPAAKPVADKAAAAKPEADTTDAAEKPAVTPAPVAQEPVDDGSIHSGVFQGTVSLEKTENADLGDDKLQALPGDVVRITYLDARHIGEGEVERRFEAKCVEGNLGGVRVTKAVISDEELRLQTQLRTAAALTNIGNRYKEFGLKTSADAKYQQALTVCDEIMTEAVKLGGTALEQTYVQLWKIYFEMDRLDLASAMCQRLQREFPTSGFVDEALLSLGDVARKQGDMQRAIGIYGRLVGMQTSQLRGEAQFGIAECYEAMAEAATNTQGATPLFDRSFQEYKKVFDQYPDSGRVGEAVAKMANYYYKQKDYNRAIDTFETVLNDHPDAKFLDVVLFNYGRCLYRMGRKGDARLKFDQLIGDFPQSPLAADAKKISDALNKAGG